MRLRSGFVVGWLLVSAAAIWVACSNEPVGPGRVVSLRVVPDSLILQLRDTATAAAYPVDSANTYVTGQTIGWTSSNASVATVNAKGTVTAVAIGSAIVRGSYQGFTDSVRVRVVAGDLVVINDMNLFDSLAMSPDSAPGNFQLAKNLVSFGDSAPRASGTKVWYDRGRNSPCFLDGECGNATQVKFDGVFTSLGYTIVKVDTVASFATIPPDVKLIILWNPRVAYTTADVNGFKSFASQGGRIVFIGEWLNFYTQAGIDVENGFLSAMGVQMTNLGAQYDCIDASGNYAKIPKASIRLRQVTDSVSSILLACASAILPGSNAVPLFYDTTNQHLLAAVAYPDYTPLPGPFNGRIATQSRGTIPVPHVRGTGGQR